MATLEWQIEKYNKRIGIFRDIKTAVRPCLKCKTDFKSELDTNGIPYNRLCCKCRATNEATSYGKTYKVLRSSP